MKTSADQIRIIADDLESTQPLVAQKLRDIASAVGVEYKFASKVLIKSMQQGKQYYDLIDHCRQMVLAFSVGDAGHLTLNGRSWRPLAKMKEAITEFESTVKK